MRTFTYWLLREEDISNLISQTSILYSVTDSEINAILTAAEWKSMIGTEIIPDLFAIVNVNFSNLKLHKNGNLSLSLNSSILPSKIQLNLEPNRNFVDSHFVAVIREDHQSHLMTDTMPDLNCYFKSGTDFSFAAVDICNGLRGILLTNSTHSYIIHPLPNHYIINNINVPHVLVKKDPQMYYSEDSFIRENADYKARRRKRDISLSENVGEPLKCGNSYVNLTSRDFRSKRDVTSSPVPPYNTDIYVETAVFVDKDLYNHMTTTFPVNTEKELIRFVLALVNAVHLLYHDPSLGWVINFVLKRLEILHTDPIGLNRVHDIDKFLNSFCTWQHSENPPGDEDPLHWDHAVILTGLDLYVLSKNGKISNQVVGLAPVAGMCTATSSCTVNEGRHFESAYVVAHEIGHNLGMRHDGPSADNACDPTSYLMSPTLGSGKITWSPCSRQYLQRFLQSKQSRCLFDKTVTSALLDHGANNVLPGERFDAHQQCKLKYGIDSHHSSAQPLEEVCKDVQCSRDHYNWNSHPALEGTVCGFNKWCRSGRCIEKGLTVLEAGYAPHQVVNGGWSGWSPYSECASSCLHDDDGHLSNGSIGIMIASRRCNNPRHCALSFKFEKITDFRPENGGEMCSGNDQKYKTCSAIQCQKVAKITVKEFSNEVCKRASEVDPDLNGIGQQRISSDPEEACKVWCQKFGGGFKSRGWSYPDGTICYVKRHNKKTSYCIRGSCKEFTCAKSSVDVIYSHSDDFCSQNTGSVARDKRKETAAGHWMPASECFYNCITPGTGMRLVERKHCSSCNATVNVQTCQHTQKCHSFKTVVEHATTVCNKFSQRVRRLSGLGMQLSPTEDDPDRPCRLACQDEGVNHRFYLVNGEEGWFPFGTDCSSGDANRKAFCVSGKCLEFGADNIPALNFEYSLPLMGRIKRQVPSQSSDFQTDKSMIDSLKDIVYYLKHGYYSGKHPEVEFSIDLQNPIHVKVDDRMFIDYNR